MGIDEQLTRQARAAAEHITHRQRDLDAARGAFQRAVRALYLDGGSLREIADELGISHQRVHQLLDLDTAPARPSTELTCTFCDRSRSALQKLIMGPGVGICNDCVVPATTVVRERTSTEDSRTSMAVAHEGRKCSFCGKKAGQALPMARVDSGAVAICAECLDLCHEVLAEDNAESAAT
jgi:hypothetical protein